MEEIFKVWAGYVALGLEVIAVTLIAYGGVVALVGILRSGWSTDRSFNSKKTVWLGFGVWLLLGLEFELAADIVRSAISPTWQQLGQLAAVAAIRTFLNYFLEKDLEKYSPGQVEAPDTVDSHGTSRVTGSYRLEQNAKRQAAP